MRPPRSSARKLHYLKQMYAGVVGWLSLPQAADRPGFRGGTFSHVLRLFQQQPPRRCMTQGGCVPGTARNCLNRQHRCCEGVGNPSLRGRRTTTQDPEATHFTFFCVCFTSSHRAAAWLRVGASRARRETARIDSIVVVRARWPVGNPQLSRPVAHAPL